MISLFLTGLVNTILHYTLHFDTSIEKFIFTFLLLDLLIAAFAFLLREIEKFYKPAELLCKQFNEQLNKRNQIIEGIRKCFVFQKLKSNYYCIVYFKAAGLLKQVEKAKQDLLNIGVSEQFVKDEFTLRKFLDQVGQDKYQITVNQKQKKFIFKKKDEEDQTKS